MDTMPGRIQGRVLALALSGVMLVGFNSTAAMAAWTITLANETGETLTFYNVNETPPPSRLPAGTIPDGGSFTIDPEGFNPVFAWDAGISMTGTDPNGLYIGLALTDTPPLIQYKVFHYKVTPGTVGSEEDLQPIVVDQQVVEVTEGAVVILVDSTWSVAIGPPGDAGACCDPPGVCSNVGSESACANGVFLADISCSANPCVSGSGSLGTGGGVIQTSDGNVSVTFPPDCLPSDTLVSVTEAGWPPTLSALILQRPDPATVYMSYSFEPHTLEFCPDAKLCMSLDLSAQTPPLDASACGDFKFLHKDKICVSPADTPYYETQCDSDSDCGPGGTCGFRWNDYAADCDCTQPPMAKCCTSLSHFSDFGLVTPAVRIPNLFLWPIAVILILVLIGGMIYASRRRGST
jgi:hypothetical protein